MARRIDKIKAAVNTVVFNVPPVNSGLVLKVLIVLLVNEINDRLPAASRRALIRTIHNHTSSTCI